VRRRSGNDILDAQREREAAVSRYLRSHGWEYTSSTPGCLWMWRKKTPAGEVLLVDESTALSMQQHSCAIRGNEW